MDKRLVVAGALALGVLCAAPGRATSAQQANPNAERCAQIMRMLVGNGPGEGLGQMRRGERSWMYYGGDIGKAQDKLQASERALANNRNASNEESLRTAVDKDKAEVNRLAGLINRFSEQLTELKCPDAPRADGQISGGGGGGGVEATPTPSPTPTATPTATPGSGGGGRGAATIDPNTWRGDWQTDMGSLTLQFNQDRGGTQDLVSNKNAWGPVANCPENAVMYGGEITWRTTPNWGQEFVAPVVACALGGVLEGKFNNTNRLTAAEASQGRVRVGYFSFTMSVVGGRQSFAGTVRRWNHIGQGPLDGFNTFFSGRR